MRLHLLFLFSLFLASPAWSVVRTICASGCDHTTIGAAEAVAGAGDILEIQDSGTFDERWTPGGERTLRTVSGQTPIVGKVAGATGAVDLSSAGVGPVTVDGIDGGLTLRTSAASNGAIFHKTGGNAIVFVGKNFKVDASTSVGAEAVELTDSASNRDYTFEQVEFDGNGVAQGTGLDYNTSSGSIVTLENCLFQNFGIASDALEITGSETASVGSIINCTIVDSAQGLVIDEKMTLTNNIFADNSDDGAFTGAFDKNDGTFNIFEQEPSTGWPVNNIFGITVTFANAGAED